MKKTITIECPVLEGVTVEYNVMASEKQMDEFTSNLGGDDTDEGVVVAVHGWPNNGYGPDPFGAEESPMAFRMWAAQMGIRQAVQEFLADPN